MRYLIFHRNEASACFIIHNRMQLFTDYFSILALAFALQISENNFLSNEKWLVARVRFCFCLIDILRSFCDSDIYVNFLCRHTYTIFTFLIEATTQDLSIGVFWTQSTSNVKHLFDSVLNAPLSRPIIPNDNIKNWKDRRLGFSSYKKQQLLYAPTALVKYLKLQTLYT